MFCAYCKKKNAEFKIRISKSLKKPKYVQVCYDCKHKVEIMISIADEEKNGNESR